MTMSRGEQNSGEEEGEIEWTHILKTMKNKNAISKKQKQGDSTNNQSEKDENK